MSLRLVTLVFALATQVSACRASNPQDPDSELAMAPEEERDWYGADGFKGPCGAPATSCASFRDDKEFVDLCVSSGFQAKTCGCAVLCSGKVDYLVKAEPSATRGTTADGGCTAEQVEQVDAARQQRQPGGSTDRCVDSHVCDGVVGGCVGTDLDLSTALRKLGRAGCENHVVGVHCRDGFVDSLHCPETDVALLSATWTEFRHQDTSLKRCIRKVVCSDDRGGCSADHLRQAQKVKSGVDRDGCEYWLRQFCSLGGAAW